MNRTTTHKKTGFLLLAIAITTLCSTAQAVKKNKKVCVLFKQKNTETLLKQHVGNIVKLWTGDEGLPGKDENFKEWAFNIYNKAKNTWFGQKKGLSIGTKWNLYNHAKLGVYTAGGLASWQTCSFRPDLKKLVQNVAPICIGYVGWQVNKTLNKQCIKYEEMFMKKAKEPLKNMLTFLKYRKNGSRKQHFKIPSKEVKQSNTEKIKALKRKIKTVQTERDRFPQLSFSSKETRLPLIRIDKKMTEIIVAAQKKLPQLEK